MADGYDSTASSSSEDWEEWQDESGETQKTQGLFTEQIFDSPNAALDDAAKNHGFDLRAYIASLPGKIDEYDVIKIVNFIRGSVKAAPASYAQNKSVSFPADPAAWKDEKFLIPVVSADPLIFVAESLVPGSTSDEAPASEAASSDAQSEIEKLRAKIAQLQMINATLASVEPANRRRARRGSKPVAVTAVASALPDLAPLSPGGGSGYESDESSDNSVSDDSDLEKEIDSGYFAAYGSFHIHEDMLKDRVRTEAYRDFMYKNKDIFKDKVVLDVGCGTGILSMFAANAGARRVFAVDASDIIEKARLNIQENNLSDKIMLFKGKAEQVELPEPVDFIISEWMGYCLLFETMLPSVVHARNRWMKPGGHMYPEISTMHMVACSDPEYVHDRIEYWQDVYGFKMSAMQENVLREAHVDVIEPETIISSVAQVAEINTTTTTVEALDRVESNFELKIDYAGDAESMPLTNFVVYFDIEFDRNASNLVGFSTGPRSTPTHWKQTVIILKNKTHKVSKGDVIRGKISFSTSRDAFRDLDITMSYSFDGKPDLYTQTNFVST